MLLRPLLVKKIACGLGKSDRFKSIYAALYFFPILTVLQAVGGGLLCEYEWVAADLCYWVHIQLVPVLESCFLLFVRLWPHYTPINHFTLNFSAELCRLTCAAASDSLCVSDYAFPYIILVLSLVTLAVYMSASEIQVTALTAPCVFVICSKWNHSWQL